MINKKAFSKGFTLAELIVVIFVLFLIIEVVYSGYLLSRKSYLEGEKVPEITQNGRVILERVVREVRQAREMVTELSEEESGATSSIEFEDGHISSPYHYIRYFKEGNEIKREIVGYYFSGITGDPEDNLVPWDSIPPSGQSLATTSLETPGTPKVIGEWVNDLSFWGSESINIALALEKRGKTFYLRTKVYGRNF